jgi:hypothetical protein
MRLSKYVMPASSTGSVGWKYTISGWHGKALHAGEDTATRSLISACLSGAIRTTFICIRVTRELSMT